MSVAVRVELRLTGIVVHTGCAGRADVAVVIVGERLEAEGIVVDTRRRHWRCHLNVAAGVGVVRRGGRTGRWESEDDDDAGGTRAQQASPTVVS